MILVITNVEISEKTGLKQDIVSHGINLDTDQVVTLPQLPVNLIGATFDPEMGEYVLKD